MVSINTHLPEHTLSSSDVEHWINVVSSHYNEVEMAQLTKAVNLVWEKLGEENDRYGEQHMHHVLSVCEILISIQVDVSTLLATLLQGIFELEILDIDSLIEQYGQNVAHMVDDLHRIAKVTSDGTMMGIENASSENLRRLLLSIADDVRVILIVLARRTHRMRRLKWQDESRQQDYAHTTLDIHAPLANRLGIWQIKWELEDLSLRYLHPQDYKKIASLLDSRREEREGYIQQVVDLLQHQFHLINIQAKVYGRPKHIFSIWKKMQRKKIAFDQVFDVLAVRVMVNSVAECYAALGIVHGQWHHIPGEFDDYIATPKGNNYQSLHTAVVGPGDKPVEVQVRTYDMHQHAEFGVAAHWRYKEGGEQNQDLERRILWMRQWLEQKVISIDEEIEDDEDDTNIYVLSPEGKVVELPHGSTPIDFAYAIHTSVGHRTRGAKVDGKMVPLTRVLESAQTVEILTAKQERPSRDWLNPYSAYIKTSRARNRIKQWLKHQNFDQHLSTGKASFEQEVQRLGIAKPDLNKLADRYNLKTKDDLYAAIGRGDLSILQVIGGPAQTRKPRKPKVTKKRATSSQVVVDGVEGLVTYLAQCCKPVHGDEIQGFITKGKGVSVHRSDCHVVNNLNKVASERIVDVHWNIEENDQTYRADVQVIANDRKGLLRDLSNILSGSDVDVLAVNTQSDRKNDTASMRFSIEIQDMTQLSKVMDKMSHDPDVINVYRKT